MHKMTHTQILKVDLSSSEKKLKYLTADAYEHVHQYHIMIIRVLSLIWSTSHEK